MEPKLQPIENRLIVTSEEAKSTTGSGLIIPDTAKEKPRTGTIVSIGTGDDVKKNLKVGDQVMFGKYTGETLIFEDKPYLVLKFEDVLAKI